MQVIGNNRFKVLSSWAILSRMTIGQNIARVRRDRGLTQVDLAKKLHVSQPSVAKVEKQTGWPDALTMLIYAEALGCEPGEFFRGVAIPVHDERPAERETDKKETVRMDLLRQLGVLHSPFLEGEPYDSSVLGDADLSIDNLNAIAKAVQTLKRDYVRRQNLPPRKGAAEIPARAGEDVRRAVGRPRRRGKRAS